MVINNLDELSRLLSILNEAGVRQFNLGDMQILLDVEEEDKEDEEYDEKEPSSQMGFETTDYSGLNIETEFDV